MVLGTIFYYIDEHLTIDTEYVLVPEVIAALAFAALVFRKKAVFTEADNEKKTLIEMFPIPNTKEDIIEFLILASSKVVPANGLTDAAVMQRAWNKIWGIKCRQVYDKSALSFPGDKQSLARVKEMRAKIEKQFVQARNRLIIGTTAATALIIGAVSLGVVKSIGADIKVPESASIAPENVTLTGAFTDHLKVTGNGVVLATADNGAYIKITGGVLKSMIRSNDTIVNVKESRVKSFFVIDQ